MSKRKARYQAPEGSLRAALERLPDVRRGQGLEVWFEYVRFPASHTGFRGVLPRRWVVERTIARIGRNRRMSKAYEYLLATSEAWVYLSMIRVMLKRLAREQVQPDFHYRRVA